MKESWLVYLDEYEREKLDNMPGSTLTNGYFKDIDLLVESTKMSLDHLQNNEETEKAVAFLYSMLEGKLQALN